MKAEQGKLEGLNKYCKDCKHYSRPACKKQQIFTARKSNCPDWARR